MSSSTYPFESSDYFEDIDTLLFTFYSRGKKTVLKAVEYSPVQDSDKFHQLNFGDLDVEKQIDFYGKTDNGDARKVFKTVASTLPLFFDYHPDSTVFIEGSTKIHMEVYIKWVHLHKIDKDYVVKGGNGDKTEDFKVNTKYEFLLISRS